MKINEKDSRPLYLQIQEGLETGILTGIYLEEEQIPSTTDLSVNFQINPATALKGINGLVDEEILYKKRGIGVFVKKGAVHKIMEKRKKSFKEHYVLPLVKEAARLQIGEEELILWIQEMKQK